MAAELLPERLPKQWSYGVTRDGRVFFVDDGRRLTTWLHPVSRRPIQTGLCSAADLPPGWELDISPEGTVYYVDHVNCTTESKRPPLQMHGDLHPDANQSPGFNSKDSVQPNQRKTPGKPKVLDKAPAAKRSPNSKVYLRGWLYKQDTSGLKQWKKKWCVLADFGLFFYKDDDEKQDLGSILLPSYQISTCYVTEPVSKKYAFKLEHSNMKTYYFAAESIESMERWVLALQQSAKLERTPGPDKERNNNYITPTHERYPDNDQQRDYHSRSNPSRNHSNPSSPDDRFRDNSPMNLRRDPYQNSHDLSRNSQSSELSNLPGNNKSWQNPATFSRNVDNRLSQSDIGSPNDQSQGGSGYFYPGYSDSLELGKSDSKQPLLGSRDPMPAYIIDSQGYDGGGVKDQDGRHRDRDYYDDERYGDSDRQRNDSYQQTSPHQRSNSNTSWDKYAPSSEGRPHNQPWNRDSHQDYSPNEDSRNNYPKGDPRDNYSSRDPGVPRDSYSSRGPGGVRTDSYSQQDPLDSFKESGYDPRNNRSDRNPLDDTRNNYSSRDPTSDERDLRSSNQSNPRGSHGNNDKGDNRQQGQGHTAPAEYSNPHQSLNNVPDNYPEDSMDDDQNAERGSYSVRKQELSRSMSELSKPQTMDSEKIRELYQSGGSHRKDPAKNKADDDNRSSRNDRSGYPSKMDAGSARSSVSETRKGSPQKLQHWQHRDLNATDPSPQKTQNAYASPPGRHGREDSFEDRLNRQEGSGYPQQRHQRYPSDDRQNQRYLSDDRQNQRYPSDENPNQLPDRSNPSSNQTRAGSSKRNPGLTVTTPDYVNVEMPDDSGGGYSEGQPNSNRPPLPAALRNMIINELAQNKTPQTSSDYLQSAENSQIRFNAPKFFQYPTPRTPSSAAKPDTEWQNQENSNSHQQPVSQRNQDRYGSKDSSINNLHADGIRQAAREAIAQKVRDYEVSLSGDRELERAKSNSNINLEGDRFNNESARDRDDYDDHMKYNVDEFGSPQGHIPKEDFRSGENEQNDGQGNMNSDPMMDSYLSRPLDQRISMASSASGLRASASDWPWNKPKDPSAPDDSHRDYQRIDNDIPGQDIRNDEDPRFSYASQTSLKQVNSRPPYPNEQLEEEFDDQPQDLRKSQGFSFPHEDLSRLSYASHDADDRDRQFLPERDAPSQLRHNRGDIYLDDPEDGQNDVIEPHYSTVDKNQLSNSRVENNSQTSEPGEGRSPPYLHREPSRESYASQSSQQQGQSLYPDPQRGDMLPPYQYDPSRVSYVSQLSQPKEVPIYAKINDPLLGQLSPPNEVPRDPYQDAVPRYGVDRTRYTDPNFRKPRIHTVKEDPSMADEDVIETNIRTQKKHPLNGHHLRLSISAGDLIGKTHDELVLLLIQLRRNQSELEKERDYYRHKLDEKRPFEQQYKRSMEANSPTDRRLQGEHQKYVENKRGMEEAEKKLEVYKPLVNLVDNMVTMGSLYGGDNYMLATQYKKHLLRPDQYTAPKELLEFSRQHQEDKMIEGIKEDIKQLDHEEVDLEEKLERLYVLDRQLQEQSFMVTSLQEDRVLLEKALQGVVKQQDDNCDVPREMARLTEQQRTIEKEISRVMHQLAEASKKLENTTAENSRLEHEVALLRSKVHGELTRSRSAPSLTNDNLRKKASLEKDLAKVKNMMSGLSKEGARLTQAMNTLRRSNSIGALAQGLENVSDPPKKDKKKGTYIETDLDTMEVVDLAVSQQDTGVMSPEYPDRTGESMDEEQWDIGGADDNTKRFFGIIPKEKPKAQTVRDVKRQSEQRREKQKKDGEGDGYDAPRYGEISASTSGNQVYTAPAFNHNRYPSSVSDASTMEPVFQTARPPLYENLGQSENSQQVGDVKQSPVPFNASASTRLLGPKPFVPYQEKPAMTKIADKVLPIRTVSPINATTSTITDSSPVITQPSLSSIKSIDYTTPKPYGKKRTKSRGQRYLTISSSEPLKLEQPFLKASALQSPAGDLISNAQLNNTPNLVRSAGMSDDLIDEYTIDRMVLFRPEKIAIPDRYDPDSDDEDLTEEQREYRRDKAERIRRILTNQSLSWSKPDLSSEPSPSKFHQHIEQEKRRHHQLLAINHELAQQVTLRTKQQAALRRGIRASSLPKSASYKSLRKSPTGKPLKTLRFSGVSQRRVNTTSRPARKSNIPSLKTSSISKYNTSVKRVAKGSDNFGMQNNLLECNTVAGPSSHSANNLRTSCSLGDDEIKRGNENEPKLWLLIKDDIEREEDYNSQNHIAKHVSVAKETHPNLKSAKQVTEKYEAQPKSMSGKLFSTEKTIRRNNQAVTFNVDSKPRVDKRDCHAPSESDQGVPSKNSTCRKSGRKNINLQTVIQADVHREIDGGKIIKPNANNSKCSNRRSMANVKTLVQSDIKKEMEHLKARRCKSDVLKSEIKQPLKRDAVIPRNIQSREATNLPKHAVLKNQTKGSSNAVNIEDNIMPDVKLKKTLKVNSDHERVSDTKATMSTRRRSAFTVPAGISKSTEKDEVEYQRKRSQELLRYTAGKAIGNFTQSKTATTYVAAPKEETKKSAKSSQIQCVKQKASDKKFSSPTTKLDQICDDVNLASPAQIVHSLFPSRKKQTAYDCPGTFMLFTDSARAQLGVDNRYLQIAHDSVCGFILEVVNRSANSMDHCVSTERRKTWTGSNYQDSENDYEA